MFEYAPPRRRVAHATRGKAMRSLVVPSTTVVTVVDEALRSVIDAAAGTLFNHVHVDRVAEAVAAIRAWRSSIVLVSPTVAVRETAALAQLVAHTPGIRPVALAKRRRPPGSAGEAVEV